MAARPRSLSESLLRSYRIAHARLLTAAEGLSPEQFGWSGGPSLHSVAWQLWHAARWDDIFASYLHRVFARDPRAQVWERESLADRWSLASGSLGRRDTGTEMSDEMAEGIALTPDDQLLAAPNDDPDGDTKLDNALIYLEHLSRHLGTIESIRGLQGLDGSSAR